MDHRRRAQAANQLIAAARLSRTDSPVRAARSVGLPWPARGETLTVPFSWDQPMTPHQSVKPFSFWEAFSESFPGADFSLPMQENHFSTPFFTSLLQPFIRLISLAHSAIDSRQIDGGNEVRPAHFEQLLKDFISLYVPALHPGDGPHCGKGERAEV